MVFFVLRGDLRRRETYVARMLSKPSIYLFSTKTHPWLLKKNIYIPRNPLVRPHSNTSKKYDILITRGSMKTLAIRSDFDFKFS